MFWSCLNKISSSALSLCVLSAVLLIGKKGKDQCWHRTDPYCDVCCTAASYSAVVAVATFLLSPEDARAGSFSRIRADLPARSLR